MSIFCSRMSFKSLHTFSDCIPLGCDSFTDFFPLFLMIFAFLKGLGWILCKMALKRDLSDAFLTVRLGYVFWRGAHRGTMPFSSYWKHRLSAQLLMLMLTLIIWLTQGLAGFPSKVTSPTPALSVLPVWQGVTMGNTHPPPRRQDIYKNYLEFCTEFFHTHWFIQSFLWSWIPTYLFCTQGCNTHFLTGSVLLIVPTWASWSFFWLLRRATVGWVCVRGCARVALYFLTLLDAPGSTCICSAPVPEPAVSPSSHGSSYWRVINRKQVLGARMHITTGTFLSFD